MSLRSLFLAALLPVGALANNDGFAFMPAGGQDLLLRVYPDTAARAEVLAQDRDATAWKTEITARDTDLAPAEIDTLAAYLAAAAPTTPDNLPRDGRATALAHCQSCHSLFTGYLMQRRSAEAWRATFVSPFHQGIQMTDQEKEIFAGYSAINMPLSVDRVPPELRF